VAAVPVDKYAGLLLSLISDSEDEVKCTGSYPKT
jgi:hypothetical protein